MKKAANKNDLEKYGPSMPDGTYFQLKRKNNSEAQLIEIKIENGKPTNVDIIEDVSRICLAKMIQKIQESYGN